MDIINLRKTKLHEDHKDKILFPHNGLLHSYIVTKNKNELKTTENIP